MSHLHLVSSLVATRDQTRPPKVFQRRDMSAVAELQDAHVDLGFRLGRQIFNQPPYSSFLKPLPSGAKPFPIDLSFARSEDAVLSATRPNVSDVHQGPRRKIWPVHTSLEVRINDLWEQNFIEIFSRDHMKLHKNMRRKVRPGFEFCRDLEFQQINWGAQILRFNNLEGSGEREYVGPPRTPLFLLVLPRFYEGGPRFVSAYGVDGCTTLIWAHRLRRDWKEWLERPVFLMALLQLGEIPDHVTDLSFCDSWPIEPALVHEVQPDFVPATPELLLA